MLEPTVTVMPEYILTSIRDNYLRESVHSVVTEKYADGTFVRYNQVTVLKEVQK